MNKLDNWHYLNPENTNKSACALGYSQSCHSVHCNNILFPLYIIFFLNIKSKHFKTSKFSRNHTPLSTPQRNKILNKSIRLTGGDFINQLKRYTIIGIIFVLITGTLSHFVYEWTGKNYAAGLFFPTNESTWEHMKLIFFPMLLYSFFMNNKLKQSFPCITSALYAGILAGIFSIPVIFYTYSGILGYSTLILDILTFVLSVLMAFQIVYKLTLSCRMEKYTFLLSIIVCIVTVCFLLFTYYPPHIGLFKNPT